MDSKICFSFYECKVGNYVLGSFKNRLCYVGNIGVKEGRGKGVREAKSLKFKAKSQMYSLEKLAKRLNTTYIEKEDAILMQTKRELDEYFDGKRKIFNVSLLLVGTPFQKSVWKELLKIPYGETISYKELAKRVGNEKAYRAAANANGANNIGIIIPCHRVIASNGGIGGYTGGVEIKKRLLEMEAAV